MINETKTPLRETSKAVMPGKTPAIEWVKAAKLKLETLIPVFTKWLQQLTTDRNPFAPSVKELEQARLMGLYLAHTNTKPLYPAHRAVSRERHRGRHANIRETVPHFPR
jgi:hypothetical protein